MKDGVVQQIADPDTMFEKPVNLFVASFIGSPGMNFLAGQPAGEGRFCLFGQAVSLPHLSSGKPLIFGLRPEHIALGAGPACFEVLPSLVESLGSEKYVYFDAPDENRVTGLTPRTEEERRGDRLIARLINAGPVKLGEPLMLSFDPARLHVFDPATGQALR
jgi:multiple sugar transport system ATP-binding protein